MDNVFKNIEGSYEDIKKKAERLKHKWEKTNLLEGLPDTRENPAKRNMAMLLENQAKDLHKRIRLNESSEVSDIKGFTNIAFPMVRRIFGGLLAQELVSVQPMSLPSGLLFYLDYTFGDAKAGGQNTDWSAGGSVYGDQTDPGIENLGTGGHYFLNSSYSNREVQAAVDVQASGTATWAQVDYDPDLSASVADETIFYVDVALTSAADYTLSDIDETNYKAISISGSDTNWAGVVDVVKRHNTLNTTTGVARVFYSGSSLLDDSIGLTASFVKSAGLTVASDGTVLTPSFESDFSADIIPELDISIKAVSVNTETRKLKAKWTPELAQDLNAYHALDAEAELTSILSEQVALDIDREILSHLLNDATGARFFWSREPGKFIDKETAATLGGSFTGNVREWYETLVETCLDVANQIHRKTLRGKANFMVCGPDVSTMLEASVQYKAAIAGVDDAQFSLGMEKAGSLANRFTVYVDPYFPRNKILLGYKGSRFLETGYVYAPYVPLIVTPTIFAPEDFTPRKAVMTRYAKKMVRSDMYGTVTILDMNVR